MFDPLPDDLAVALVHAAPRLGAFGAVRYCREVESTNDVALSLAAAGAPEGTTILADVQSRGRGRRGHEWYSPSDAGLYLSVITRPEMSQGAPLLTLGAGVAMAAAVSTVSGLPVELKWPNDLVIGRPWRKLGGVLAETVSVGAKIEAVVVGMGVNVRQVSTPANLRGLATSLEAELGRFAVDRTLLTVELLAQFRLVMEPLHANGRHAIIARWRGFAKRGLGGTVRWTDARGEHRGTARDIAHDGALLVATPWGDERIVAGEVTWEAVPGE
jgi:BirA family biotin operon repressor/biotin-[acetyl-CoA-carboxylase] ligase